MRYNSVSLVFLVECEFEKNLFLVQLISRIAWQDKEGQQNIVASKLVNFCRNFLIVEKSVKEETVSRSIRGCLTRLMKSDERLVKEQLSKLVDRLNECHDKEEDTSLYLGRLFLRIHSQYPGDVGCFMIYFLNYIQLEPYESIYFGSGVPHCYLQGGKF